MIADLSGAQWFKSSQSSSGDECVEAAWLDGGYIGVRDSKNPAGPALQFGPAAWDGFTRGVRNGVFTT